jgi:hypothetical protein
MTTDNIYKFAALLGLALLASVAFLITYLPDKYSESAFNNMLELRLLKSKDNPSKEETIRINALEEKDKGMAKYTMDLIWGSAIIAILGIFLFLWGVIGWLRRIQPKQDELLDLQIAKRKLEIIELENKLREMDKR